MAEMTEEEGNLWITLATLHGPSTLDAPGELGSHDPLQEGSSGDEYQVWWVYRDKICKPSFSTRAEAARHYCQHYGIAP